MAEIELRAYCPNIYTVDKDKLANATKNKSKGAKNNEKKKWAVKVKTMFYIYAAIVSLVILFCSPLFFKQFYDVNTLFCREEFYDSNPTEESIECRG